MDPMILIVCIVALAAIAVAGALYASRLRRRSKDLRARFGPEYDRAVEAHHDRRAAELELAAREQRVRSLQLRPLSQEERGRYADAWAAVQRRFVDDPIGAVTDAHRLLEEVLVQRGYPAQSFEEEVALLSVHHPASVQHYRAAHALAHRQTDGDGATEENRQAVIHYRALFEELLEEDDHRARGFVNPAPHAESRL